MQNRSNRPNNTRPPARGNYRSNGFQGYNQSGSQNSMYQNQAGHYHRRNRQQNYNQTFNAGNSPLVSRESHPNHSLPWAPPTAPAANFANHQLYPNPYMTNGPQPPVPPGPFAPHFRHVPAVPHGVSLIPPPIYPYMQQVPHPIIPHQQQLWQTPVFYGGPHYRHYGMPIASAAAMEDPRIQMAPTGDWTTSHEMPTAQTRFPTETRGIPLAPPGPSFDPGHYGSLMMGQQDLYSSREEPPMVNPEEDYHYQLESDPESPESFQSHFDENFLQVDAEKSETEKKLKELTKQLDKVKAERDYYKHFYLNSSLLNSDTSLIQADVSTQPQQQHDQQIPEGSGDCDVQISRVRIQNNKETNLARVQKEQSIDTAAPNPTERSDVGPLEFSYHLNHLTNQADSMRTRSTSQENAFEKKDSLKHKKAPAQPMRRANYSDMATIGMSKRSSNFNNSYCEITRRTLPPSAKQNRSMLDVASPETSTLANVTQTSQHTLSRILEDGFQLPKPSKVAKRPPPAPRQTFPNVFDSLHGNRRVDSGSSSNLPSRINCNNAYQKETPKPNSNGKGSSEAQVEQQNQRSISASRATKNSKAPSTKRVDCIETRKESGREKRLADTKSSLENDSTKKSENHDVPMKSVVSTNVGSGTKKEITQVAKSARSKGAKTSGKGSTAAGSTQKTPKKGTMVPSSSKHDTSPCDTDFDESVRSVTLETTNQEEPLKDTNSKSRKQEDPEYPFPKYEQSKNESSGLVLKRPVSSEQSQSGQSMIRDVTQRLSNEQTCQLQALSYKLVSPSPSPTPNESDLTLDVSGIGSTPKKARKNKKNKKKKRSLRDESQHMDTSIRDINSSVENSIVGCPTSSSYVATGSASTGLESSTLCQEEESTGHSIKPFILSETAKAYIASRYRTASAQNPSPSSIGIPDSLIIQNRRTGITKFNNLNDMHKFFSKFK